MITFFHTADIHFGVENYGKVDPKTGIHTRLLDFSSALEQCINQAIEQDIDFFLLCGDAYKTAYPTPTQQKLLCQHLLRLHHANIPVVIVVGNHDHPLSFGKANALDVFDYLPLNNFYVFSKPDSITINTKNGPVQIVGIPWPTRNTLITHRQHHLKSSDEITSYLSKRVSQLIAHFAQGLDPSLPAVLAGHLTVSTGIFSGSEKCAIFGSDPVFLPSQLAVPPFDYVALGHLHRHQNLNPNGTPPIIYSGSIERIDFGERKEEKGYCQVTIDKKECQYSFIPVTTRPMIQCTVKLTQQANQTEQITEELSRHNLDGAILKIVYHLPPDTTDKVDLGTIQRACSMVHYLAGIVPVHTMPAKRTRTKLSIAMNLETLLKNYFEGKKELKDKQEVLIKKALQLYETFETDKQED